VIAASDTQTDRHLSRDQFCHTHVSAQKSRSRVRPAAGQLSSLENKEPAGEVDRSFGSEAARIAGCPKRPRVGNRDAVVFVQFALPSIVEEAEGRVATLLNFSQNDAGAVTAPRSDDASACAAPSL